MMKNFLFGTSLFFCFVIVTLTVFAQPFDMFRGRLRKVEADASKDYKLVDTNGPWMIMAASFSGETAEADAKTLAMEFRSRYNWEAYVYDQVFVPKLSENEAKRSLYNRTLKYNKDDANHEYCVLVGNFVSFDDVGLNKTLTDIRNCSPACFQTGGKLTAKQRLESTVREGQYAFGSKGDNEKQAAPVAMFSQAVNPKYPCQSAFPTTNPLLPRDFFGNRSRTVDAFVEQLNANRPYSLLKNPAIYTVQVATFTGDIVINQTEVQRHLKDKERNNSPANNGSKLEKAGQTAIRLCAILRAKGYEAYEFHDRYSSIVTIGSFNNPGIQQQDGSVLYAPEIADIITRCTAKRVNNNLQYRKDGGYIEARQLPFQAVTVDGIALDLQPKLIMVPRAAKQR
ncbi:MAG: hypothetical protein LBU65_12110 [Planctomycetaceae bacterium]|jgi:hypothetical protein|nr:hypothetical protein [Planctomycetaceae bacterium]